MRFLRDMTVVVNQFIYPAACRVPNGTRQLPGFHIYIHNPVPIQKSTAKPCGALWSKWGNSFSCSQASPGGEGSGERYSLALRSALLHPVIPALRKGWLLHPLAASLASFFICYRFDYAVCGPGSWGTWPRRAPSCPQSTFDRAIVPVRAMLSAHRAPRASRVQCASIWPRPLREPQNASGPILDLAAAAQKPQSALRRRLNAPSPLSFPLLFPFFCSLSGTGRGKRGPSRTLGRLIVLRKITSRGCEPGHVHESPAATMTHLGRR